MRLPLKEPTKDNMQSREGVVMIQNYATGGMETLINYLKNQQLMALITKFFRLPAATTVKT